MGENKMVEFENKSEKMWFVEKKDLSARAIVFDKNILKEFSEDEWQITGEYNIELIGGDSDFLPDCVKEGVY